MESTKRIMSRAIVIIGVVVFLAIFSDSVSAQAQAPAPSPDCFNSLVNMSECLTFVEVGSNLTKPDKGCCPALAGLVESSPVCLCQLLSQSNIFGVDVNKTKALKLPSACRVTTPSVSLCAVIGIPVGVPVGVSPAGEPTSSPISPGPGSAAPGSTQTPKGGGSNGVSRSRDLGMIFYIGLPSALVAILF